MSLALQQAGLTGVVRDSIRMEPVAFAQVTARDATGRIVHTTADDLGAFVVSGLTGTLVYVSVSAVGYQIWHDSIPRERARGVRVLLNPLPIRLRGIEITAPLSANLLSLGPRGFLIDSAAIAALPKVLETDVLRAATLSPSTSSNSDFSAMPLVRGGTAEGVPVLLDGIRLFNPFHLLGFISAINAEAVDHVSVITSSGGAALRDGAYSGTLEIATRDGARDRLHASGAIGLASSRLTVEGPIGSATSFLIDGRRTYVDMLTGGLERMGVLNRQFPYAFSDIHAKLTTDLGGVSRISATAYRSGESLGDVANTDESVIRSDWSNEALGVSYRCDCLAQTLLQIQFGYSQFQSGISVEDAGRRQLEGHGDMRESRGEARISWQGAPFAFGAAVQAQVFTGDYGIKLRDPELLKFAPNLQRERTAGRLASYAELRFAPTSNVGLGAGVRVDRFGQLGATVSPSLAADLRTGAWSFRLSTAESRQALFSLRNEESVYASFVAYDLLLPIQGGPLLRNREMSVSATRTLGSIVLEATGYVRRMEGLRLLPLGISPLRGPAVVDPDTQHVGRGNGRGVELSGSWKANNIQIVGSYVWSSASRTVDGETYIPRFHRDHEMDLAAAVTRGSSVFSARFTARSGQPYTPLDALLPVMLPRDPGGAATHLGGFVALGGRYNTGHLPSYSRLDLGWRAERAVHLFGIHGFAAPYAALLNAGNSKNVVSADVDEELGRPALRYLPQLPTLPFFGLELRF